MVSLLEKRLEELKNKTKLNKEGVEAFIDDYIRALYLQGLSLNLNTDAFYYSKEEKFQNFIEAIENVIKNEKNWFNYLVGITLLLKENQRKLSPVIITAYLMRKWKKLTKEEREILKELTYVIADTPKRLRELLMVYLWLVGEADLRTIPAGLRKTIKRILEDYSAYTLLNNNIKKGPVTLRDIIKFFHPNPTANLESLPEKRAYELLYKAIIENRASLTKFGFTNIVVEKSLNQGKMTIETIKTSGINQLIRNLLTKELSKEKLEAIKERLINVLLKLEKSDYSLLRVLNIYDIFSLVISPKFERDEYRDIIKLLNDILRIWILYTNYIQLPSRPVIVQDLSGSMDTRETLFRSAILLALVIMKNEKYDVIVFDSKYNVETEYFKQFKKYREEPLRLVYELYKGLEKLGQDHYFGGTALRDAVMFAIKKFPDRNYIVISDEVSWADDEPLIEFASTIGNSNSMMIFYNPERDDNDVQVIDKVIRIAGLSTQVFSTLLGLEEIRNKTIDYSMRIEDFYLKEREKRTKQKINDAKKIIIKLNKDSSK